MASNVFPMLSSSPPPIDDCPDDDDDEDEFGNFTSANIPFDSSFDSPVAVEKFKSFKSGDNGVNNAHFSDEIHKFNFSNSTTPSPHEFVPDFPNETEHSKNGFKPIKSDLCENDKSSGGNSTCHNKTEIASHKPVPPVPSEHLACSLNDSGPFSSKGCDIQNNTVINCSNKNDCGKGISKDLSDESDSVHGENVCNLSKDVKDSSHIFHESKLDDTCSHPKTCASDSYTNPEFSKCNKNAGRISPDGESLVDKFDCSFNFEGCENDTEDFADFQHSENLFPPNVHSSTVELDSKFSTAFDEDSSETALKPSIEDMQRNEFSNNDFDDFQACGESSVQAVESPKTVLKSSIKKMQRNEFSDNDFDDFQACGESSVQAFESPKTVLKSSIKNMQVKEFSDNEFDDFQGCGENMVSAQAAETSEVVLESTVEDKQGDEFSDYEFDDFQAFGEETAFAQTGEASKKSNNDDYDEFQEFQFSDAPKEDADDFADFQDFNPGNASDTDNFADFSSAPFESNKISEPSENKDFADFKEAAFSTPTEASSQVASSTTQKSIDTLSTVINAIFPVADTPQTCDTPDETSPQILEQSNKSRRLWEKLHEVEQAPGLRFQWGVSHSFQQLLRAVNVDYHSILRTSSVPIFASGLSLLEPVKGLSSSANHDSEDRNQNPKDPSIIPPVEFDWTGSGLTNPLDCSASTLMDLSFLSSVGNSTNQTSNDNSFENELLKPSPAFKCPESNSQTHILEQLLSKNVSSLPNSKLSRRPSDLSDEAIRVLDQLPDLSFMQAKVLMFPISSKT